jgi:hypothetical protein
MNYLTVFLLIVSISICSCGQYHENRQPQPVVPLTNEQTSINDTLNIKVYVNVTGKITANGDLISLIDLDTKFSELVKKHGIVWYSRDNVSVDPPKESMQVMALIVKYGLSVKFFTDKDFQKPYTAQ